MTYLRKKISIGVLIFFTVQSGVEIRASELESLPPEQNMPQKTKQVPKHFFWKKKKKMRRYRGCSKLSPLEPQSRPQGGGNNNST